MFQFYRLNLILLRLSKEERKKRRDHKERGKSISARTARERKKKRKRERERKRRKKEKSGKKESVNIEKTYGQYKSNLIHVVKNTGQQRCPEKENEEGQKRKMLKSFKNELEVSEMSS